MQNKLNSFFALVLLSLLGHLALAALVLQQQFVYPPPEAVPAPIQVVAVARTERPPAPASQPAATPAITPSVPTPRKPPALQPALQPANRPVPKPAATAPTRNLANSSAVPAAVPSPADRPLDVSAILHHAQQQAMRRELSAAELAALASQKPADTRPNTSTVRRPAIKPGSGPAGDVLEILPDGTQLVRVGKQCALAATGADLKKDIHSIKLVSCGAGGKSGQDKIDAHFEQVMSTIGQHR